MDSEKLRSEVIAQGDTAFLALAQQVGHLLELAEFYFQRYPEEKSRIQQLETAVATLGSVPYQLAEVIRRWKNDEPRVLDRLGVEVSLLNELWITMEATAYFFNAQEISVDPYNQVKAYRAFQDLVRINRVIQ